MDCKEIKALKKEYHAVLEDLIDILNYYRTHCIEKTDMEGNFEWGMIDLNIIKDKYKID